MAVGRLEEAAHGGSGLTAEPRGEPAPFDFNSILTYDPKTGILTQRGTRVVITGTGLLSSLRASLLESYPYEQIRQRYLKAGYDQGFQDALSIAQTQAIDDDFDFVKLGSALTAPAGRARLDIEKVEFDILQGRLSVRCRFIASHEAIDHVRLIGPSKEGVCWTLCGYAQGFVEALFDKPVFVVEYRCLAMGHTDCALFLSTYKAEADAVRQETAAPTGSGPAPSSAPALSYESIREVAGQISASDRHRLVDFFARKDAELERSRLKYRALIDASPDVILEVGGQGSILLANEQARNVLGRTPQSLLGEPLVSLFHPDDAEKVADLVRSLGPDSVTVIPRVRLRRPQGSQRFAELSLRPLAPPTEGGATLVELHDITDRLQLEEELADREARKRAVFDNAADGILVWGPDGTLTEANPAAEKILGYRPGELEGRPIDEVIMSVKRHATKGGRRPSWVSVSRLPERKRWVGDARLRRKGGHIRPAVLSLSAVIGPEARGDRIALVKDLSELEALEEELRAERGKTAAIVDAIAEPMAIFSPEGTLEWSNPYAELMFGRRRVIPGTPCHLLVCEAPAPCAPCPLAAFPRLANNPGAVRRRHEIRTTDGVPRPYELTLRRIQDRTRGPLTLVLFRDVTEESGEEARMLEKMRRRDINLEISELLLSARNVGEMLERFSDRAARELDLSLVSLLLKGPGEWVEPAIVLQGGQVLSKMPPRIPASTTGLRDVLSKGEAKLIPDADKSAGATSLLAILERAGAPSANSLYLAPLSNREGSVFGVLVAGREEVDAFEQEDLDLIKGLAYRAGLALDGALLAEANRRVLRLQEALIAEGELMTRPGGEVTSQSRRFLELLADRIGATACAFVYLFPDGERVRLASLYTAADGHVMKDFPPVSRAACPLLSRATGDLDVQIIDLHALLAVERNDAVMRHLIGDHAESLVQIRAGLPPSALGWIVVALPSSFRISTAAEIEVLRNLAQQVNIAIGATVAQGGWDPLLRMLEGGSSDG